MTDISATDRTLSFYDRTAETYAIASFPRDASHLYDLFLPLLPASGRILDAGCGSGRDSAAFAARGFQVTAFDASAGMVEIARGLTDLPVRHMRFQDVAWDMAFDGIWACASLLHLPRNEELEAWCRLRAALVEGGVLFVCYKQAAGSEPCERMDGDRLFLDQTAAGLERNAWLTGLEPVRIWTTEDILGRGDTVTWLNGLFRRI